MNAPALIDPRRQAELHFVRKLEATAIEMREAVHNLNDASLRFRLAQINEDFSELLAAGKGVVHFADQVAFLAGGIKIATQNFEIEALGKEFCR